MKGQLSLEEPRFLADVMLGTLAKWLRILGYDTVYDNRIQDHEIVARCLAENRIALTRDRRLVRRRLLRHYLLIESDCWREQLSQVLRFVGHTINPEQLLSRCVECNQLLDPVARQEVRDLVPPYVFRTQSSFKRCPRCRRVFWGGTHREHMLRELEKLPVS